MKLIAQLLLFSFLTFSLQAQFLQVGMDIDGEAPGDFSGYSYVSLSTDGNIVAIGAYNNDDNGSNSGHVRVYSWDGTAWAQLGQDIDGEATDDRSGTSLSVSADGMIVAVGAPLNDDNGVSAGHVRIYNWDGLNWIQRGLDIDGEAAIDRSGISVSLSADGNTVAIGAPRNSSNAGHVRVYNWDGSNWNQQGLDIDGEANGDESGTSVSLSADGNTVAIGAPENENINNQSGHVRIYNWDGSNWVQKGLDIDGEANSDESGFEVSLSANGRTVAIGAPFNDGIGQSAGHTRVYNWNGSAWVQQNMDIEGEAASDLSGHSVGLSADGRSVAIGAPGNTGNGTSSGHVRVFQVPCFTFTENLTVSLCFGGSIEGYSNTGVYTDTFQVNGCDSIRILDLTVLPLNTTTVDTTICLGESFTGYSATGTYVDTLTNAVGCDSIRTLNLTVNDVTTFTQMVNINPGDSVFAGGAFQTMTGTYTDTLVNAAGCDSIITTELQVLVSVETIISSNIKVFPNPASNRLEIVINNPTIEETTFSLFTLAGKQVLLENVSQQNTSLNLNLAAGTYFYTIKQNGNVVITDRLVIVE